MTSMERFKKAKDELLAVADRVGTLQEKCQRSLDPKRNEVGDLAQLLGETMAGWTGLIEALADMAQQSFKKRVAYE